MGKSTDKFTITIVPVLYGDNNNISSNPDNKNDIIKFGKIGIITYDW